MSSIEKLKGSTPNSPYSSPLKLKVIAKSPTKKYMRDGEEKSWTHVGLADSTGCIKAIVYDEAKLAMMKEGSAVMLRNYIYRDHTIVITKASKTVVTGGIGAIPEEIAAQAKQLLDGPPPAQYLKIQDALKAEPSTLVSLKGKIIRIDDVQMRKLQSQQSVPVRSIIIKDETGSAKVSLWREQSASELLQIDNYISLTNMKIGFYKERYFNSCSTSQLTNVDAPIERMDFSVEAFVDEDDGTFTLVCKVDGTEEFEDFTCTRAVLNSLVLDGEDAGCTLTSLVPIMATIEYKPQTRQTGNIVMSNDIL